MSASCGRRPDPGLCAAPAVPPVCRLLVVAARQHRALPVPQTFCHSLRLAAAFCLSPCLSAAFCLSDPLPGRFPLSLAPCRLFCSLLRVSPFSFARSAFPLSCLASFLSPARPTDSPPLSTGGRPRAALPPSLRTSATLSAAIVLSPLGGFGRTVIHPYSPYRAILAYELLRVIAAYMNNNRE